MRILVDRDAVIEAELAVGNMAQLLHGAGADLSPMDRDRLLMLATNGLAILRAVRSSEAVVGPRATDPQIARILGECDGLQTWRASALIGDIRSNLSLVERELIDGLRDEAALRLIAAQTIALALKLSSTPNTEERR